MSAGIVTYGGYVPRYRIRPKEIGAVWGADGEAMGRGLNIKAKSVPGPDEDVITISVEAARAAMARVDLDPTDIVITSSSGPGTLFARMFSPFPTASPSAPQTAPIAFGAIRYRGTYPP